MNLLYVGPLPPHRGGSAIVASYLLAGLRLAGHRVRALAPLPAGADPAFDAFAVAHPGVFVVRFQMAYHSSSFAAGSTHDDYRRAERHAIRRALPDLIADERPDIVILGRESIAWHAAALVQRADIPSLLLVHGGASFAGVTNHGGRAPHFRRLRSEWRRMDRIVAVAMHLGKGLASLGFRDVTVIPNPVDLVRFSPGPKSPALLRALAISPDDFVILHASNLRPMKRPSDIVASAEIVLTRNCRARYVIVGEGPGRDAMQAACREKGIESRFRFPGWIDHAEMPDYIRLGDVIVMPSESEGSR